MKLFLCGFFLFLFCFPQRLLSQQPVIIQENFAKKEIGFAEIYYLSAGDSVQNLSQARDHYRRSFFIPSQHLGINLGIAKDNYWVRLLFINSSATEQSLYLSLENPRLNEVNVFFLKQNKIAAYTIGDNFPFNNRPVYNNQFALPVLLAGGDSLEAYFFIKHKGNTLQVPITLYSRNEFLKSMEGNNLFFGFTSGILIIILVFGVFFLFNYFSRVFLFYSFYIMSLLGWLWSTEGYGFQYFWPGHPTWATRFGPGFSVLNLLTFTLVLLAFCKPYDSKSIGRKIISYSLVFTTVWGIVPFLPTERILDPILMAVFLKVNFSMYILILFIIMGYLFWLSFYRSRIVLYYFFGVIITMIFSLVIIAKNSGFMQMSMSSGKFMSVGLILEVVLMTAGITRQLYSYKKEKEAALIANAEQQKSINSKILQMQDAERLRISRELHDDLGSGLTQITLIGEHAKQQIKKGYTGTDELEKIAETSRQMVEKVSEIIWTMNPKNNSLADLLVYLREQLNKMLEFTSIQYTIDFTEVNPSVTICNEQRRSIILLLKEVIHNIIKHSRADTVNIKAFYAQDVFLLSVTDNGIGFDTEKQARGNGLKNMRQRAHDMDGGLDVVSQKNEGTVITFKVLLKSHS